MGAQEAAGAAGQAASSGTPNMSGAHLQFLSIRQLDFRLHTPHAKHRPSIGSPLTESSLWDQRQSASRTLRPGGGNNNGGTLNVGVPVYSSGNASFGVGYSGSVRLRMQHASLLVRDGVVNARDMLHGTLSAHLQVACGSKPSHSVGIGARFSF